MRIAFVWSHGARPARARAARDRAAPNSTVGSPPEIIELTDAPGRHLVDPSLEHRARRTRPVASLPAETAVLVAAEADYGRWPRYPTRCGSPCPASRRMAARLARPPAARRSCAPVALGVAQPPHQRSQHRRGPPSPRYANASRLTREQRGLGPGVMQLQIQVADLDLHPPRLHPLVVPRERQMGRDTEQLAQRCGHAVPQARDERAQLDRHAIWMNL